jgi:hypothetical protein
MAVAALAEAESAGVAIVFGVLTTLGQWEH